MYIKEYEDIYESSNYEKLSYSEQITLKTQVVHEYYKKLNYLSVKPFIENPQPKNYRHKVILSATNIQNKIKLGLFVENTKTIKPTLNNDMHDKEINRVFETVEKVLQKYKILAYDVKNPRGIMKHIFMRKSFKDQTILICFVTQGYLLPNVKNIIKDIVSIHPNVVTVTQNIHFRNTPIVLEDKEKILYGSGYIFDEILGFRFRLSTKSFYQINPRQMLNLYAKALELANIQPTDIVLDCYSGIGTMSILFASKAKKVIAVENNPSSVQDAKYNQRLNKIQNIEFVLDDATNYMNKSTQKMDILVMDPPRSGSTPEFLDAVLKLKPRKVVYVSCDIETQVRDIKQLLSVYHIKEVIPIDMFSDTKHIELVTLLELK